MSVSNHAVSSAFPGLASTTSSATTSFSTTPLYIASSSISRTAVLAVVTSIGIGNSTSEGISRAGAENGECRLLGPFALFVQGALGLLALLSLVFKRWRERPQRPVKIWAFDASKQVVGSALLHVANLFMSMLSSGELTFKANEYQANPCSFYLLNLAIDTTLGIPILIVLLRILTHGFSLTPFGHPPESIQSGNYGRPPKTTWWLKQCVIYFIGLLGMKLCVYFFFQICPWIIRVGDWALKWTEGNEMMQVFFVMLFFPVIMNALQYYIIDSFIKNQRPLDHEPIPSDDGSEDTDDDNDRTRRRRSDEGEPDGSLGKVDEIEAVNDNTDNTMSEDKEIPPSSDKSSTSKEDPTGLNEYDPAIDGEASTSSSSGTPENAPGIRKRDDDGVKRPA